MKWNNNNTITVDPPKYPKKITGTRLAAIFGLNEWSTPFKAWCAITKTYEEPFEDNIYTIAGKTIEPKQADWVQERYFWKHVLSPTEKYGVDYFNKTRGDFFPECQNFGGMWDYILCDKYGEPEVVLEMKTTKRAEDWSEDIPEYYAMQAALYAYLLKINEVAMVCTILEDKDYENPEDFKVTDENTFIKFFKVSERYPQMVKIIAKAEQWWEDHVETGISPEYDEKKDAEILKVLRANNLNPETDVNELLQEADELQLALNEVSAKTEVMEKRLKVLKDLIKETATKNFREGDKNVIMGSEHFEWVTSKSITKKIDEDAMKKDGVLDKYKTKETTVYKLVAKTKGEK